MNSPFPVRLRAASVIPRWSIVHTLKADVVSSHSWFVAVYSNQIAGLIGWAPTDVGAHCLLLRAALLHDIDELATGDLVAPVKTHILDAKRASDFISRKMFEMLPGLQRTVMSAEMKLIIKAADQLDALLYAIGEQVLGNGIIAARIPSCYDKLREAWFKLPGGAGEGFMDYEEIDDDPLNPKVFRASQKLADLWLDVVVPAINEHRDPLRYDIGR